MEVTIGTRIDRIINAGIVAIGDTAAWLLNRLSPFDEVEAQRFLTMGAADALADMEAENESWLPDELWAATLHHNTDWDDQPMGEYPDLPDSAPGFQPPVERIAGDVGSPAGPPPNDPPGSAAGHPKTEAEWIEFAKHFDFDGFRRQHPTT